MCVLIRSFQKGFRSGWWWSIASVAVSWCWLIHPVGWALSHLLSGWQSSVCHHQPQCEHICMHLLPPNSMLAPWWNHASTSWVKVSTPVFALCSHIWPLTLDAAPGQEEELQSSAFLWWGGIWGGLSWATSSPGPERSQHAQRIGACMHLSTQGLRWEPAGCTWVQKICACVPRKISACT